VSLSAINLAAVTPSDSVDLTSPIGLLYTGSGGTIVVIDVNGTTNTFTNVPAGTWWKTPVSISRVKATSTTATGMIAAYGASVSAV
jgi:hypothetical protein